MLCHAAAVHPFVTRQELIARLSQLTRVQCDFRDFSMRTSENIVNIRAQAVRGTAEHGCRAQAVRGTAEHECRVPA